MKPQKLPCFYFYVVDMYLVFALLHTGLFFLFKQNAPLLPLELIIKFTEGKPCLSSASIATNVKKQGNFYVPHGISCSWCLRGLIPHFVQASKVNFVQENFLENIILNGISHHYLSSNPDSFHGTYPSLRCYKLILKHCFPAHILALSPTPVLVRYDRIRILPNLTNSILACRK